MVGDQQQVHRHLHLHHPGAETRVRAQAVRGVTAAEMLLARLRVAVDVEFEGVGEEVLHVVGRGCGDVDPHPLRQLVALDHARVHDVADRHRHGRPETQALHDEAASDVGGRSGERLGIRVAVGEHGIGLGPDHVTELRLRQHGVDDEAQLVADVHAGEQGSREHEPQIRLRKELPIIRVDAQQIVGEIPGTPGPLSGGVDALNPIHDLVDQLRPTLHARGLQHEPGHGLGEVRLECPLLEHLQVLDDVL